MPWFVYHSLMLSLLRGALTLSGAFMIFGGGLGLVGLLIPGLPSFFLRGEFEGTQLSGDVTTNLAFLAGGLVLAWVGIYLKPHAQATAESRMRRGQSGFITGDWSWALTSHGYGPAQVNTLVENVYRDGGSITHQVLPPLDKVFRAFEMLRLQDVRVVIVGMDPYDAPGLADGLAFSVPPGWRIPYSLGRVFDVAEQDLGNTWIRPQTGDLSRWASNGVLLLNAALTVRAGEPGSHSSRWAPFGQAVLELINLYQENVVFMLWGDNANDLGDSARIDQGRHYVIRSTHPRQESTTRYPRFRDSRPFSQANRYLYERGREPIDWSL